MPGAGFRAFRIPGHDNGDGAAVPPEGDEVEEAVLTWQLLHQRNVQLMRNRGIINTDAARVKMKNLVQGDTPMDTYLDAFRKTHIDVHGSATDIMLRVPECVDGMADTHMPQLRTKVPHAMPPQAAARADLRNGVFAALSWEEFESLQTLNEANRRQILGLVDGEPYAPAKDGQVTYHPDTGNTVPDAMGIHAVQTDASNTTASASYDGGRPVTMDEMSSARREMEAAQQKALNHLSLEVTALTAVTSQTQTQVKQIITNVSALSLLAESNSSSLEALSTSVQKLTNATAGRERPSYEDRKCYNCGEKGHIARGCPHKAKKSAITAVSSGSMGEVEFKEQYGSKDEFINCLARGVEDSPATGDIIGEPLMTTDCEVSAQVRHESAPARETCSMQDGEQTQSAAGEMQALFSSTGREEIEFNSGAAAGASSHDGVGTEQQWWDRLQDMLMLAAKIADRSTTDKEQLKASELHTTVPTVQTGIAADAQLHATTADAISADLRMPFVAAGLKPSRASDKCQAMPVIDEEAGSYCSIAKALIKDAATPARKAPPAYVQPAAALPAPREATAHAQRAADSADWMILPIHEGEVGLVPLVCTTKIELQDRHFLQGHAPLILRDVTKAAAVQQLDDRCQVNKQALRVVLKPEEHGRKRMGVIICTIEQKERHLSDEHKKLQRSAGQVPPRWDNQAWTSSKDISTPLYSHLGNESVRKVDFYGLTIALTSF